MAKEKLTDPGVPESTSLLDVNSGAHRKAIVPLTPLQQFEIYRKLLRGDAAFQWVFFNLELSKCNPIIIG
jgi:hypothetical protein